MATNDKQNLSGFTNGSSAASQMSSNNSANTNKSKLLGDYITDPLQRKAIQDLGQERANEIVKNLNNGFLNDAGKFKDTQSLYNAYGYYTADSGKQALIDAFAKMKGITQSQTQNNISDYSGINNLVTNNNINSQNINSSPITGISGYDNSLLGVKNTANNFIGSATNNANTLNNTLTGVEQQNIDLTKQYENKQNTVSDNLLNVANEQYKSNQQALEISKQQELQKNQQQLEAQQKQNAKDIAGAKLLASLTGGTGGSGEYFIIKDTENTALNTIRNIQNDANIISRTYDQKNQQIKTDLLNQYANIEQNRLDKITTLKSGLLDKIKEIELTKGKNTTDALNAMYQVANEYNNNVVNITKQAESDKLNAAKLAEEKRQYNISSALEEQKLNMQIAEANNKQQLEIYKLQSQEKSDALKTSGQNISDTDANNYAKQLINGTIQVGNIPKEGLIKVLNTVDTLLPTPSNFEQTLSSIQSVIPTSMKSSDSEQAKLRITVKKLLNQGLTPDEVKLSISTGLNTQNNLSENASLISNNLRKLGLGTNENDNIVANNLNSGDIPKAIEAFESNRFNSSKNNDVKQAYYNANNAATTLMKIKNLLQANKNNSNFINSVGTIPEFFRTYNDKFGNTSDPNIVELKSLLSSFSSQIVNKLAGSAVSDSEYGRIQSLFPAVGTSYEGILNSTNSAINRLVDNYNAARKDVLLPKTTFEGIIYPEVNSTNYIY